MTSPAVLTPDIPEPELTVAEKKVRDEPVEGPDALEDAPEPRLLENFEKEEHRPYVVDYLDLYMPYYPAIDNETTDQLELVDEFVKDELDLTSKNQTVENYTKVLDGLKKKLGIEDGVKEEAILERLAGFVKGYNHIKELKEKRSRREILDLIYKIAKGRNFDSQDLELLITEEYLKNG